MVAGFQVCSLNRVNSDKPQKASRLQQGVGRSVQPDYPMETFPPAGSQQVGT